MIPSNIHPTLLLCDKTNYNLFKIAIYFAEQGLNVWFISPTVFDKLPENIIPPDKEILQLITFIYLKDYKSLLNHLNAVQLWHKSPTVILLAGFDSYTKLFQEDYNPVLAGFISCTILDSASVCFKKNKKSVFIILSMNNAPDICADRIKVLHDLYFPNIIKNVTDEMVILEMIMQYYKNK